jgi:predicted Zn-dependent protease
MRKLIFELLVFVALLGSVWFLLSKVDWMTIFKVEKTTQNMEEKIGDLFWDLLKKNGNEITADSILSPVDSMLNQICTKNKIKRTGIKFHLVPNHEINAFAFPGNHLVVYTGLISSCENEAELCGVLCHEIAHMEKRHIMNKLVKDFGLSVLVSMSTGNGNSEVIKEAIKNLSSTAYDRNLENEADMTAVGYLIKANIDPEPFANFLYRLSNIDEKLPAQIYWISTHPDSKERAEKIIETIKNKTFLKIPIIGDSNWALLKKRLKVSQ